MTKSMCSLRKQEEPNQTKPNKAMTTIAAVYRKVNTMSHGDDNSQVFGTDMERVKERVKERERERERERAEAATAAQKEQRNKEKNGYMHIDNPCRGKEGISFSCTVKRSLFGTDALVHIQSSKQTVENS